MKTSSFAKSVKGGNKIAKVSYFVIVLCELILDLYRPLINICTGAFSITKACCVSCWNGDTIDDDDETLVDHDEESQNLIPRGEPSETEYVFVDFNALEFSNSDELWAGLIRNIYNQVELRLEMQKTLHRDSENVKDNKVRLWNIDWKRKWRVQKAKDLLIQHYGSVFALQLRLVILLLLVIGVLIVLILSLTGNINIWNRLRTDVEGLVGVVSGAVAAVLAAIPSVKLLYKTDSSANTSTGESIFQEANRIQDNIGFLSRVKGELDELFTFVRSFEASTGTKIVLLIFVDDLDRCFGAKTVKVLEAIQLMLTIAGAPVMVFLSLDSRVAVASIEATVNKSLSLNDALISGFEYMDRVVDLPFCIPESSADKMEAYFRDIMKRPVDVKTTISGLMQLKNQLLVAKETSKAPYKFRESTLCTLEIPFDQLVIGDCQEHPVFGTTLLTALSDTYFEDPIILILRVGSILTPITSELVQKYVEFVKHPAKPLFDQISVLRNLCAAIQDSLNNLISIEHLPKDMLITTDDDWTVESPNLLSKIMSESLLQVCTLSESNPRRLNRILDVLSLACEVAKYEHNGKLPVARRLQWPLFSVKLAKWIYMGELYPYRMSFLIQILSDFDQKYSFNQQRQLTKDQIDYQYANPSGGDIIEFNAMNIAVFFQQHVEPYIFAIESAQKLMKLDSDPDLFLTLMFTPIKFVDASTGKTVTNILCSDILGPYKNSKVKDERDSSFSLLSYSYNVNPTMAKQISQELQHFSSEVEIGKKISNQITNLSVATQNIVQNITGTAQQATESIVHNIAGTAQQATENIVQNITETAQQVVAPAAVSFIKNKMGNFKPLKLS